MVCDAEFLECSREALNRTVAILAQAILAQGRRSLTVESLREVVVSASKRVSPVYISWFLVLGDSLPASVCLPILSHVHDRGSGNAGR